MRTKRQNIQLELALEPEAKGEARSAGELLSNLVYGGLVMRRPCCPR